MSEDSMNRLRLEAIRERDEARDSMDELWKAIKKIQPDLGDANKPLAIAASYTLLQMERNRLRGALELINTMACYASEEDTESREKVLLAIGEAARATLIPPERPEPTQGPSDVEKHGAESDAAPRNPDESLPPRPEISWGSSRRTQDARVVLASEYDILRRWAEAMRDELREVEGANNHLMTVALDAHRFRFLTEDHDDPRTRERVRAILDSMKTSSYSAMTRDIDAARTEAFKRAGERDAIKARKGA